MKAKTISHLNVTGHYYRLQIHSPQICKKARPGQFIMLKTGETLDPLLRRPFSIHKINKDKTIDVLYKVVGKGTRLLSGLKKDAEIDILGPLGNGFTINKKIKSHILVAGGIGIAPLLFLAQELSKDKKNRIILFAGARHKEDILSVQDFKRLKAEIKISTEDGSIGKQGLISELFEVFLTGHNESNSVVYACGPKGMLREISRLASIKGISCQVSLEERMACGLGACLGCATDTKGGYKYVCNDGPVFEAGEIVW